MRYFLLVVVALALLGCGEQQAQQPQAAANSEPVITTRAAERAKQPLPDPDFDRTSKLAVLRRTGEVKVGMTFDDALAVFAQPQGASEKGDLPPSIGDPYQAKGWQTRDEGFGTILYKGQVAAAVYTQEHVKDDRVQDILDQHIKQLGPPKPQLEGKYANPITGAYVRYWFWESDETAGDGNQILMICATEAKPQILNLTVAVGTAPLMEALGMTPAHATQDQPVAERLIAKQKASAKANSANSSNRKGA